MKKLKIWLLILGFGLVCVLSPGSAFAQSNSELQNRINRLNNQISKDQAKLDDISSRANTLQNKVDTINAQIAQIQSQIDLTNLQITQTQAQINDAIERLERQKIIMFENAKTLYKIGNPTTIEVLASSTNFSEFINRQEYLESVKDALNQAAREILALKEQLEAKQKELQDYLKTQETQRRLVEFKRDEQARLLAQTRGEEARYQQIVKANKEEAQAAQAELNSRMVSSGGTVDFGTGSYPYPDACGEPYPAPWDPKVDSCPAHMGGYIDRQCTSYAYWRRGNIGKEVPGFWGNAGDWPSSAEAAGYKVDYKPEKGAIGVIPGGFGHVFIVEEVLGPNTVRASQYNYSGANGGKWGKYSVVDFDTSGLQFIH